MITGARVFVTGATGFIGTKLVQELVERGYSVRALVRPSSKTEGLDNRRVELRQGNTLNADSLRRTMQGCEQVYHLAAYAKNWAPSKKVFFEQNVTGTRNVLSAAEACGVKRVVITSSIVTLGPTAPGVVGDETLPRTTQRFFTEYEETKSVAEREVLVWAARGGPAVIVNPTRVYGPGKRTEGNSVTLMIEQYNRGRLPVLLNGGVNVGNYAFVDDLVRGYVLAMEKGRVGERYILGGENASLKCFFQKVDEAAGRRHRQISLPPWAALAFARFEQWKAGWFGLYPQITPGWVETFLADWAYSCAKAERELGYTITPLKEGIRATCEWLATQRGGGK
ncbi:MAG TPA: SDR family oxidoreductase [Candidatus Acidoferrum sp.]|jgi:nucleoside-diphosphate-sugar epimerase|nr:SDR family oxidoreductase [Candidatus Acidoferrum sp.]